MAELLLRTLRSMPNTLSFFRLACSPAMLWCAWTGKERQFLAFLTTAMISDLFDGSLARLLEHTTELGAKLDSAADFLLALAVLPCIWWLWPHLIEAEVPYFLIILMGSAIQISCGAIKFRKVPSYHTWASKAATFLISCTLLTLLFTQKISAPFRFSAMLHLAATADSLLITLILPRWDYNVPSAWHAFTILRDEKKRAPYKEPPLEAYERKAG